MRHKFVAFLSGRIQTDGMRYAVVLRKRHLAVEPIDARRRCIHKMTDLIIATSFKYVDEAVDIAFYISMRVGNGITHSGLRGKIHDRIETSVGKKHTHGLRVLKINAYEHKVLESRRCHHFIPLDFAFRNSESFQTPVFQCGVIIVVDVIETHDNMSVVKKSAAHRRTNKSCGSCY